MKRSQVAMMTQFMDLCPDVHQWCAQRKRKDVTLANATLALRDVLALLHQIEHNFLGTAHLRRRILPQQHFSHCGDISVTLILQSAATKRRLHRCTRLVLTNGKLDRHPPLGHPTPGLHWHAFQLQHHNMRGFLAAPCAIRTAKWIWQFAFFIRAMFVPSS